MTMTEPASPPTGTRAMMLAAGLGTRMRPLTDERPKPLVEVAGKALIDHALERLRDAGVEEAVVNVHYKADMLEDHLRAVKRPKIIISDERQELLETGGGLVKALPHLGTEPFFMVNTDSLWIEGARPSLERLRLGWDDDSMDMLLLICSTVQSHGYSGPGDFHCDADGTLSRRAENEIAAFVFTGVYMVHPRIFDDAPKGKFSMNVLFDRAMEAGRLKGLRHDGIWMEINTPEAIATAEQVLQG
ncbi:MAG: nucleotidyltransferase family protein [Pseudomonadota bacterium]